VQDQIGLCGKAMISVTGGEMLSANSQTLNVQKDVACLIEALVSSSTCISGLVGVSLTGEEG